MCYSDPILYTFGRRCLSVAITDSLAVDSAVEAINLAATELTAAILLLLLNKFLLPPSLSDIRMPR